MALLRASSSALGDDLDVAAALTRGEGVPGGQLLLDFAAAAHLDTPDLTARRADVEAAFGEAGLVEACLTIGAFSGLTRVADATGIVLDGGSLAATHRPPRRARPQRDVRRTEHRPSRPCHGRRR